MTIRGSIYDQIQANMKEEDLRRASLMPIGSEPPTPVEGDPQAPPPAPDPAPARANGAPPASVNWVRSIMPLRVNVTNKF